ncbi:unnamed protein product [Paramecium pentaurelia]|uniref:Uncharacterized protein n=1 Tax=Paramecium pentaurelia TaxID=43138 RepID=A0A8S1U6W6_9CILI|nr:unnamed protein product [Paramecium pentaurelia]
MSTARFKKTEFRIQEMQTEIDALMTQLQSNSKNVSSSQSEQLQMLIEDLHSTNFQTQELSKESDQLTDALYSQSDHDVILTQAQMKKIQGSLNQFLSITKQNLQNVEKEIELIEKSLQTIQEQNKVYTESLSKFRDNLKMCDTQVVKVLDQTAYNNWNKIKQFFDVDIIQTSVPLGLIMKVQLYILKLTEACNSNSIKAKQQINEDLTALLIEINSQNQLFQNINLLEQYIMGILKSNNKVNLFIFIQKCMNSMHFNFCQIAQIFNQHNISYKIQQSISQEIGTKNQCLKSLQVKKSQFMIEMEKFKKQSKELTTQVAQLEKQLEKQIEAETQHLLAMYLRDKEQSISEIKKKYGKKYFDNMLSDVKQEFKKICLNQQVLYANSIEQAFLRVDVINTQLMNNKTKAQQLIQQYSQQKFKKASSVIIQLNGIDKREYLLELQQCKIQLLQIENKVERKMIIQDLDELLLQIQYQINDIKLRIQASNVPQKIRSDSIDTQRKTNRTIEHHRSQSQTPIQSPQIPVPQITLQLLNINLPINNPKEIFDSSEDPIKSNNSQLQLSFCENQSNKSKDQEKLSKTILVQFNSSSRITQQSNNIDSLTNSRNDENQNNQNNQQNQHQSNPQKKPQLKEVRNIMNNSEQIQNSLKSSRTKKETQQKQNNEFIQKNKLNILIYLKTQESDIAYDPILNYDHDPYTFGYRLFRIDNQLNIYKSSEEKINLENFENLEDLINQFTIKYTQLENIKDIEINNCSLTALKFQNIYESTLRHACVDSLALRHLRVRFFPFVFLGQQQSQLGLAVNKDDIQSLQKLFSK